MVLSEATVQEFNPDLIRAGEMVDRLVRFLASRKVFPNEQINHFMRLVEKEALGTDEEGPTSPWLIVAVDENDSGFNTDVLTDRDKKYLIVSAGFSRLNQAEPEAVKQAVAEFIFQTTLWFTWGRRYGPSVGPRRDWAESRKKSFLETVAKQPELLTRLINNGS